MATKRVNSESLNLRKDPQVASGNILAALPLAHTVTTIGPAQNGWVPVRTSLNGTNLQGYVSEKHLRDPVSDAAEKLVETAVAEWERFGNGVGKEHHAPYYQYVGQMWQALGINLDGRDRDQPWSAAFISWVVRQCGQSYNGFKHAAAHARYIHDSIRKCQSNTASPFWGFRLNQHKVQIGDMVCQWRVNPRTYDDAAASDSFFSHCDIVVELDGGRVRALGGNVSDSVSLKNYARDASGYLLPQNKVFAVLRNNTP